MKKITLILIAALICSFSFAQKQYQENSKTYPILKNHALTNSSKAQTLVYNYTDLLTDINTLATTSSLTGTNLALYGTNGGEYVCGHNEYGDTIKLEQMTFTSPGTLDSVMFLGAIGINSGASSFNLVVYNDNAGLPGTAVSTTPIQVSSLTTESAMGFFPLYLATPYNFTAGTYYVGITFDYSTGYDTLGLFSTVDATTANYAFETYNSNWVPFTSSWNLNLSLSIISCVTYDETSPSIAANPTLLNFYGSDTKQSTITTANLTEDITITTTAPYEVSIDNTTFSTSVTMPQAGGILYVKYTSTTNATQETGSVSLTSTGVTTTISLTGIGSTSCDLEALFYSDDPDNGGTAITDITITSTEDLVIVPVITNYGPDACNTSAQITVTIDATPLMSQAIDFTGFASGEHTVLSQTGITGINIPVATLDQIGTNSFEVCITVAYPNDPNTANDNACIAVTREGGISIEENVVSSVSVYPNPSTGLVNVTSNENGDINIYDITGKLVNNNTINAGETVTFDLSAGMYFVNVNGNSTKVVVE